MTDDAHNQSEGSEIRRPKGRRGGTLIVFVAGILVGSIVGAGVYAALAPRSANTNFCSVSQDVTLTGAGATFPFPLIDKWRAEYNRECPNIQINYQSIGSGGGIAQITAKTVDFGASDAPLNAAQRTAAPGLLVHVPETIGAVVLAYRIPNVPGGLNLTGPVIADIFLGNIDFWDDPALTALNPSTPLAHEAIFVVHRSDGSGTTFVFTDYLSKVSTAWQAGPGKGTSVSWPVGLGAKGNEGVAGVIQGNAYSIGYVELAYGIIQRLTFGSVRNAAGNFIVPSLNSTSAAADAEATTLPAGADSWEGVSITNASGADSYPISSLTYILVYQAQVDAVTGKVLADFLWWAIHDGQQYSSALQYVPLPANIVALDEVALRSLTHNGTPILTG